MSTNEKKHALDSASQTEGSRAKKPKLGDNNNSSNDSNDAPAGPFVTGAFISAAAAAANEGAGGQPPVVDEEKERRKQEEIRKIEQEFSQLKEKFFAEKIAALKKEIDQLTQGTHEGYLNELRLLEEKKQRKLLLADQWRQYQQQCLNLAFESEKKHSEDENLNDAKELQDRMLKNMLKRRKQLEEQKADLNLNDAPELGRSRDGNNTRQLRKRGKDAMNSTADLMLPAGSSVAMDSAPKKTNVPEVRVTLSDDEIDADLHAIQRIRPSHATRQSAVASDLM